MAYREDLDGLRALAVVAVIVNHFDERLLPGGYLGVDIFFVISGFVITSSLYRHPGSSFVDLVAGFYARRVKRLVPALAVCVAITSLAICLFDPSPGPSLRTGIASLVGMSNVYLYRQATDYFGGLASLNAFTHTWSLGVEEQFYVLFPFLVWFSGFGRSGARGERRFRLIAVVVTIASVSLFVYIARTNESAAFYAMPTRLWELGAGCLAHSVLAHSNGRINSRVRTLAPWTSVALGAALFATLLAPREWFIQATVAAVALTTVLIITLPNGGATASLLRTRAARFLGRISYSLYLWHWVVLVISRWTIGIHWWSAPFQLGLILLFAYYSYRYVEEPLRYADWSSARWKTIALGVGALFGVAVLLLALHRPLAGVLYAGRPLNLIATGVHSLTHRYAVPGTTHTWNGVECVLSGNEQVGKRLSVERCTLGDRERAGHRVVVIGNSYSAAFVPAFDAIVQSGEFAVTITSSWGASAVPEIQNKSAWDKANYYYWASTVPRLVDVLRAGDWVLLINEMDDLAPERTSAHSMARLRQLQAGLDRLSSTLAQKGIRLAVLHGNPFVRDAHCDPAIAARQWFSPFGGPCRFLSRDQTLSRRQALDTVLATLQAEGKITVVDLIDVFCPGTTCSFNAAGGEVLYRDAFSHPSVEAARLSAPIIRKALIAPPRD